MRAAAAGGRSACTVRRDETGAFGLPQFRALAKQLAPFGVNDDVVEEAFYALALGDSAASNSDPTKQGDGDGDEGQAAAAGTAEPEGAPPEGEDEGDEDEDEDEKEEVLDKDVQENAESLLALGAPSGFGELPQLGEKRAAVGPEPGADPDANLTVSLKGDPSCNKGPLSSATTQSKSRVACSLG